VSARARRRSIEVWPETRRGRALVSSKGRSAGALDRRCFGLPKNESPLLPLRIRGRERVALHAELTMLSEPSCALTRERAIHPAAQGAHPGDFPLRPLARLPRAVG
jgi:hypothetical protein